MDRIVIVKLRIRLKPEKYQRLREYLLSQVDTGIIVVPDYCDVLVVPDDGKVKIEVKPWEEQRNDFY